MDACTELIAVYHRIKKMYSVDREVNFSIAKPPYFEVEPTFGIALIQRSLSITGSPNSIMIV